MCFCFKYDCSSNYIDTYWYLKKESFGRKNKRHNFLVSWFSRGFWIVPSQIKGSVQNQFLSSLLTGKLSHSPWRSAAKKLCKHLGRETHILRQKALFAKRTPKDETGLCHLTELQETKVLPSQKRQWIWTFLSFASNVGNQDTQKSHCFDFCST